MKVLLISYPRFGLDDGGLQLQVRRTASALQACGVETVWLDPWTNQIPDVDVVHVFSLDGSALAHVQRAKELGVPVVVSPVFNAFSARWALRAKVALSRTLPGSYTDLVRAGQILRSADHVIFLNEEERRLVSLAFGRENGPASVIPNGLDPRFAEATPGQFADAFGLSGKRFVLSAARFSETKNQLTLVRAMTSFEVPLVLIGGPTAGAVDYIQQCRREASASTIFVGELLHDDPLLPSAFAGAHVFALPSLSEVMPLALLEAAAARCHLVTSANVPVPVGLNTVVTPPKSVHRLRRAIGLCLARDRPQAVDLGKRDWSEVGLSVHSVYAEILDGQA